MASCVILWVAKITFKMQSNFSLEETLIASYISCHVPSSFVTMMKCFLLSRESRHGKATVMEGKVARIINLSVHHGVYQLCGHKNFKSLESFELLIPHLKDPINICLEPEAQVGCMSYRCSFRKSKYPQISI